VPIQAFRAGSELSAAQVRELAGGGFEIGAHTVSHRSLTEISLPEQEFEVAECKRILEERLGAEVRSFCYPNGRMNRHTAECVKRAGYAGARTTRMLRTSHQFARFAMPTTLQAYPHAAGAYLRNAIKGRNAGGLVDYLARGRAARNWVEFGKVLFDRVFSQGGFWHLYGHSWELEEMDLWSGLEELLVYVAGRAGVRYVTNATVTEGLGRERRTGGEG
jgi:peptidoglycan/xylan/chitin deacetylase (PgdA/CDA1 family)